MRYRGADAKTSRGLASAIVACTVLLSGCEAFWGEEEYVGTTVSRTEGFKTFSQHGRIDEQAGTYRGVGLGDSPAAIRRVFGQQRPAGDEEAMTPFRYPDGSLDGPTAVQFVDYEPFGPTLRYYDVVFTFKGSKGLGALEVVEPGARTREGVAIGDPLAKAERAYPELACGRVNEETEYREFPACTGKLRSGHFIWFGGDPITAIAMSTTSLGGVAEGRPFTGRVFALGDGQFVTYPPARAEVGDKIVCSIGGKRVEAYVPPRGTGISDDPLYLETRPDGSVRAECGGVHAETAPQSTR